VLLADAAFLFFETLLDERGLEPRVAILAIVSPSAEPF
jgi:hypothetical protein